MLLVVFGAVLLPKVACVVVKFGRMIRKAPACSPSMDTVNINAGAHPQHSPAADTVVTEMALLAL